MDGSFSENGIIIAITVGIIIMLLFAMAFVLFFYFSQKKFQEQKMKAQNLELKHQEQLLFGNIKAQEKERQRIARELHDEVGSKLNVINLNLHRLSKSANENPKTEETIKELFGIVGTTIDTTRRISHDLLPPTLENFGLAVALEELCEQYNQSPEIEVNFLLKKNEPIDLSENISLNFFRVAQELMSNSFKHASASQIHLELWMGKNEIKMIFQDNGKGLPENNKNKGLGMQNIESRMRMAGAEHSIKSEPNKGIFFQAKKQLK